MTDLTSVKDALQSRLASKRVVFWHDPAGEYDTAVAFTVEDGRITRIHAVRNPNKLQRLDVVVELRR